LRANISLVAGNPLQTASVVTAWQGSEKLDRVTEWPATKVNSIVSPGAAVRVSGVKTSPFLPTATWWMFDAEAEAEAAAAELVAVVEEEDAAAPYCASVTDSIEVRSRRENDNGDMAADGWESLEGLIRVIEALQIV
jgi:hypothetical protein